MEIKLFYLLCALTVRSVFSKNVCVTPNGEIGTCVSIRSCDVILKAIISRNSSAIEFAKKSQCGYDGEPLVCCGSIAVDVGVQSFNGAIQEIPYSDNQYFPDVTICGEYKTISKNKAESTVPYEFPWVGALVYKSKTTGKKVGVKCTGTLITSVYVLTTAACLLQPDLELTEIVFGEWNLKTNPDCIRSQCYELADVMQVRKAIPHPYYSSKNIKFDIGLILLENAIEFSGRANPICLPPSNYEELKPDTKLTSLGWGLKDSGSTSDTQLKVQVKVLPRNTCSDSLQLKTITNAQSCVAYEDDSAICKSDSGSPIIQVYKNSLTKLPHWYLEGVLSSGIGCNTKNATSIYIRVAAYINWIVNVVSDNEY